MPCERDTAIPIPSVPQGAMMEIAKGYHGVCLQTGMRVRAPAGEGRNAAAWRSVDVSEYTLSRRDWIRAAAHPRARRGTIPTVQ